MLLELWLTDEDEDDTVTDELDVVWETEEDDVVCEMLVLELLLVCETEEEEVVDVCETLELDVVCETLELELVWEIDEVDEDDHVPDRE